MPGSRALFYRPPFVSWVGHLSFVLRSLPLRSLRSLRETNGGYEWRTEDGTKTRQRRYEVKGTWGDDTRWTESVTPGPWSSGVVSSPHTVPFRFTVVSVPFAHSLRSSHSLHLTPSEATGTEWEGAEWGGPVPGPKWWGSGRAREVSDEPPHVTYAARHGRLTVPYRRPTSHPASLRRMSPSGPGSARSDGTEAVWEVRARHERSEPRDERREGKASEAKVERDGN